LHGLSKPDALAVVTGEQILGFFADSALEPKGLSWFGLARPLLGR
jgi:hypothetical protein